MRENIRGMPLLIPFIHRALPLQRSYHDLNLPVCPGLMASVQMEQYWYTGLEDNCRYGMPLVLIHWHHPTVVRLQVRLVKLHLLLKERKACKYVMFSASSSGTFGPKNLMKELGRMIMVETRDERLQSFVSASVQRGNAAASLGTCLHTS